MNPVIIVERVEQSAVQKGNFTIEAAVIVVVMAAVNAQGLIEQRFERVIEKIAIRPRARR